MAIVLDESTRAEYLAQTLASSRASGVVSALGSTVYVEVYDGSNVLRASGTMATPWATASSATVTVGEVNAAGVYVSSGGVPDSLWYCQFRGSNGRFVRGTFGVSTSSADFKWSLATFQTGSRGTIGTATFTCEGSALPIALVAPVISGAAQVGQTLTLSTGTWQSSTSLTYARQWLRNGAAISGANSTTYALTSSDLGATIGGTVTATNSSGSASSSATTVGPVTEASDPSGLPLLYESNITASSRYLGSFRLPLSGLDNPNNFSGSSLRSGGAAAWFNPDGNGGSGSLFVSGRNGTTTGYVGVAEVSIPTLVSLTSSTLSALNRGSFLRSSPYFYDTTGGNTDDVFPTAAVDGVGIVIGGVMAYGGNMYTSFGIDYQGSTQATTTFKLTGTTLGSGTASGPYAFASSTIDSSTTTVPLWHRASFGEIPAVWQSRLGGPVIASYVQYSNPEPLGNGPALFAIDPANIGVTSPVPSQILVGYSTVNPLESVPRGTSGTNWMRGVSSAYGVFFPPDSGTVVVATKFGEGIRLYGTTGHVDEGDSALGIPSFGITIVDPVLADKGDHAYPYVTRFLAYRATDLADVKNSTKTPHEVTPYAQWTVTPPLAVGQSSSVLDGTGTCGIAFDQTNRRLYLIERETVRAANDPIVHVYQLSY